MIVSSGSSFVIENIDKMVEELCGESILEGAK